MKIQELLEDRNFLSNEDLLSSVDEFLVTHKFKNKSIERAVDELDPSQQEKLKGILFAKLKQQKNVYPGVTEKMVADALSSMRVI